MRPWWFLLVFAVWLVGQTDRATAVEAVESAPDDRKDRLRELQESIRDSEQNREAVRKDIEALAGERARLRQSLIEAASRARGLESKLVESERRLADYGEAEQNLKASLGSRRAVLAEVLAALQRLGRHPPPVLLVRPDAALESVRTAILLGALLPELRIEAEALAGDLGELVRLRDSIASERQRAALDLAALGSERTRLQELSDERQKQQLAREKDYNAEQKRAAELGREAQTLEGLISGMERDVGAARRAAAAAKSAPKLDQLAALRDPSRLSPAIAFLEAKGLLPLPVSGQRMREFGAPDGFGGIERGTSISSRAGAQVTAPCDGWVVYAGPFRSYGKLLILNAGDGYHVLLAGMERISVELGQFVLTGEPVAVMSGADPASAAGASLPRPVLYVEFRKDGTSIDPAPWWSDATAEKVGG